MNSLVSGTATIPGFALVGVAWGRGVKVGADVAVGTAVGDGVVAGVTVGVVLGVGVSSDVGVAVTVGETSAATLLFIVAGLSAFEQPTPIAASRASIPNIAFRLIPLHSLGNRRKWTTPKRHQEMYLIWRTCGASKAPRL